MKPLFVVISCCLTCSAPAFADTVVTKRVDTGSHTCTHQGQEKKVDDVAESGSDRYFVEDKVTYREISKFGAGSCEVVGVEKRQVDVTLESGAKVKLNLPYKYVLRAYADCTNNIGRLGSQIGTECEFAGLTQEYK